MAMRVDAGDSEFFDIVVTRKTPPVDLTTAQSLTWRAKYLRDKSIALSKGIGDGITVIDATHALLSLTPAETAQLLEVPMAYECELVEADDRKTTVDKGVVKAAPDL